MSTLTMPGMAGRSTLNPNAPLFVPMAVQQVEDFSPEWWDLVKTTAWYRDYWFHQQQEQETCDHDEDEDVVNLLPDSFDLGIDDELAFDEAEFREPAYYQTVRAEEAFSVALQGEKLNNGYGGNVEAIVRSLSSKSPKNSPRASFEQAKYRKMPTQSITPKYSPRRIIQQPR